MIKHYIVHIFLLTDKYNIQEASNCDNTVQYTNKQDGKTDWSIYPSTKAILFHHSQLVQSAEKLTPRFWS